MYFWSAMKNFASPIAPMPQMMFRTPAISSRVRSKHPPTGDSVLDTGHHDLLGPGGPIGRPAVCSRGFDDTPHSPSRKAVARAASQRRQPLEREGRLRQRADRQAHQHERVVVARDAVQVDGPAVRRNGARAPIRRRRARTPRSAPWTTRTPRRGRRGRRRRGDGSTGRSGSGCGAWCPARRWTRRGGSADIGTCPAGAGHACADRATKGPPVSALREQRDGSRESGAQPRWRDVVCSKLAVITHHHPHPRRPVPSAGVACRARRLYRLPRARANRPPPRPRSEPLYGDWDGVGEPSSASRVGGAVGRPDAARRPHHRRGHRSRGALRPRAAAAVPAARLLAPGPAGAGARLDRLDREHGRARQRRADVVRARGIARRAQHDDVRLAVLVGRQALGRPCLRLAARRRRAKATRRLARLHRSSTASVPWPSCSPPCSRFPPRSSTPPSGTAACAWRPSSSSI